MNLPLNLTLSATQTQWAAMLNPLLRLAILDGVATEGIVLVANTPQAISHHLSRTQIGWFVVDINAAAIVYRTQPFNSQSITLEATANCTINIWCY